MAKIVVCAQQCTLPHVRPRQLGELTKFKKVGWVNPSDLPQSRLKSSRSYHTDHRAAEAVRGRRPCLAGTTKSRTASVAATSVSGKTIWRELHSALPQTSCISNGYSVFSCSSSADHCAAVLSYCCNPPQSEYYILITPQLLGWTGLKSTRCSTSCHKADLLDQPSPASDSWFTIFPPYPVFPLALFRVSTSQAVSLHHSLLWKSGDLREMLPRFVQMHKSWSKLLQKAKPILRSVTFFRHCFNHLLDQVLPKALGHYSATASEKVV